MKPGATCLVVVALVVRGVELFAQAAPPFPQGTFVAPEALDPRDVSKYAGIEIELAAGRYAMRRDGEPRVTGRYEVAGDRITITDQDGVWACRTPETTSATYTWRVDGAHLVLTLSGTDACNRRRNRLSGARLVQGRVSAFAPDAPVPDALRRTWERFWLESDATGWVDSVFTTDAVAEDGNRRLVGLEAIRGWLGGQDSRGPRPFPFEFSTSGETIIEKGRYRDVFGAPDGSTRLLVGRYQITWVPVTGGGWKVREWLLR